MAEVNERDKQDPPRESWFLQLQRESWYLEMITSGVALFFIFQAPEAIEQARNYFAYNLSGIINFVGTGIFIFLETGAYIAIGSLILHLLLRAFWIGVIGLNSVLPGGIDTDRLAYSPFFKKRLQKRLRDPRDWAEKIDNICSSIYGLIFFVLFLLFGLSLYVLTGLTILFLLGQWTSQEWFPELLGNTLFYGFLLIYPLMGVLSLIDFITLGAFKRNRIMSRIYYVPYRIVGVLTLSFLIRPFYYLMVTHVSRGKGILMASGVVFLIFFISHYTYITNPYFPQDRTFSGIRIKDQGFHGIYKESASYENLKNSEHPELATIDRDIVQRDAGYLRVYIHLYGGSYGNIKEFCDEKGYEFPLERGWKRKYMVFGEDGSFSATGIQLSMEAFKGAWQCMNERYEIAVDDSIRKVDLFFTDHPDEKDQKLVAHVPIRELSPGRHELEVKVRYYSTNEAGERTIEKNLGARIPFWKE